MLKAPVACALRGSEPLGLWQIAAQVAGRLIDDGPHAQARTGDIQKACDQPILVAKVAVHRGRGNAGGFGDLLDRSSLETMVPEHLSRGLQDPRARFGAIPDIAARCSQRIEQRLTPAAATDNGGS